MRASVIVDVPARSIGRAFDYLVPFELADAVRVGCAVSVEFGARPVVGYIVGLSDGGADAMCGTDGMSGQVVEPGCDAGADETAVPDGGARAASAARAARAARTGGQKARKLKPLLGVLGGPYFDEVGARVAEWMAHEYLCAPPDALRLFTPPGGTPKMRRVDGCWTLVFPGVGEVDERWVELAPGAASFIPAKGAVRQQAVLSALARGGMRVPELAAELGSVNATLKALEKRGVVVVERRRRLRGQAFRPAAPDSVPAALTAGQQGALDAIASCMEGRTLGRVVVVDGVTGSGKTEVYLQAIARCLDAGKGAIVLVPEIALTPQTVGRFRARFGNEVAVLHSRLSLGERFDQWDLARRGEVRVVVGTRSALFAPLPDPGLFIIDEEHESSYKQDSAPRYHARDVALQMARLRGAVLVLGSATPDTVTLARCAPDVEEAVRWRRVVLSERPNGKALQPVEVVDLGAQFKGGSRSMFSPLLVEALHGVCERGEKAVLLFNRRGFASFLLCRECGYTPECPHCAVSLTYHERRGALVCHHCGHSEGMPARCPRCASPYLRRLGAGTERVEQELRAILPPGIPITRMDADTTRGKGAHERLLEQFAAGEGGVLLGTQMIAKGLDYPDVTLVGVLNADTSLKLPDYRAAERTWQLLEQVAGRAGRAELSGRVVVQTYWPEHPAIQAAARHDRALFLDDEFAARRELGYPPFTRLANILVWGPEEAEVRAIAQQLFLAVSSAFESAGQSWELLGPAPCLLSRLKGRYRWHILLKAPPGTPFHQVLEPVLARRKKRGDVRVAVDVDPASLF